MEQYLDVGQIVNTHGVKGEVKVMPLTDDPQRFELLEWVYIRQESGLSKLDIIDVKYIKNMVILKLKGIDEMSKAEALKGKYLVIDRANAVKLPKNSYFICDLIGCEVSNGDGLNYGAIIDIIKTGSNDVYIVKGQDGKDILIPALKTVVKKVDIEAKKIEVELPKGLLDDEV